MSRDLSEDFHLVDVRQVLAVRLGFWAILAAAAAALTALECSVAGMIVRRRCLNPRPSTPPLALLASLVGGGVLAYMFGDIFLFAFASGRVANFMS